MSFNKPFRAVPIREGQRYRKQRVRKQQSQTAKFLAGAALAGGIVGVGSLAVSEGGLSMVAGTLKSAAVSAGFVRANTPQPGAYYRNCDAARAAGVAPLYIGEPGYRSNMDGDGDGIACEPYRGR
jgi:hypothetical protein